MMTEKEHEQVDELIRSATILKVANDALRGISAHRARMVDELLEMVCVAKSQRSEALLLASAWNPHRVWPS